MKLTIPEMLDIAIDFLEKNLDTDESIYLCAISCYLDSPDGWDEYEWNAFMRENKYIAEDKFAGDYWSGGDVWWGCLVAHLDGKLREVYELKLAFLKHLKNESSNSNT